MIKPKLRSSVSTVVHENTTIEFFLTNTRRQVMIKVPNEDIVKLILSLDGSKTVEQISTDFKLDEKALEGMYKLLQFLESKSVVIDAAETWENDEYARFRRVMNFLEDYTQSYKDKIEAWSNIRNSKVVIVGLGAVGTWITFLLAQSGVRKFTLIDNDTVDITNLHRQLGFGQEDVGLYKIDVLEKKLHEIDLEIHIDKIYAYINENNIDQFLEGKDLVINSADKPNVDTTALWIGESCMKFKIPHIIAGGYNLHLSLIGQTIIPFQSACVKCFETGLNELNQIDTSNLRKLHIQNRKIGSFGPMCSISASIAAMEAFKVLSKKIQPTNVNRRGEFDIYKMDIKYIDIPKSEQCDWCGVHGRYR